MLKPLTLRNCFNGSVNEWKSNKRPWQVLYEQKHELKEDIIDIGLQEDQNLKKYNSPEVHQQSNPMSTLLQF